MIFKRLILLSIAFISGFLVSCNSLAVIKGDEKIELMKNDDNKNKFNFKLNDEDEDEDEDEDDDDEDEDEDDNDDNKKR